MELDELQQAANTWRIRVRLADHPGQLATLATRLSQRDCNLLGVTVLPVADEVDEVDVVGGSGAVIDELVLRAPAHLRRGELAALMESSGAHCVGIVPASVGDLVDAQTALLRSASRSLATDGAAHEPLRQVLGADSVRPHDGASDDLDDASGDAAARPGDVRLRRRGHEAVVTLAPGTLVVAAREWAPFTEGELARIPALVELLEIARRPTPPAVPPSPQAATVSRTRRTRRQLSSLDAQFLNAESSRTPTHIGVLTILDPKTAPGGRVTVDSVRSLIAGRQHLVDALRWQLHSVPLGMDLPYWVDAGELDLTRHVQEVHLPSPGTHAQLGEEVARLAEAPLPRDKPLWESYLIHGLSGGGQALYTKVHHAVVDGVSGAEVIAVIFDLAAQPRHVDPPDLPLTMEPPPGVAEMMQRALTRTARMPWRLGRSAPSTLPHLVAMVRSSKTPRTPFNEPLTANRSFAFASLPLDEVKQVKDALGFTVNDLVMALCTTALRRWLIEHDALPSDPVIASIPVSVRTPEQFGTAGNQISFMLAALPTDEADPAERLRTLSASLIAAKKRFTSAPRHLLHDSSELIPQFLHGVASRVLLKAATLGAPPFNLFVSNVAGPQLPLYAAGARVVANYPVSVVSDIGGGINITVMSYNGMLDFGVIACRDAVPDVWDLAEHLQCALVELTELAGVHLAPAAREG
jgi:diacylglycerol O-acyltransferase / wax synthase